MAVVLNGNATAIANVTRLGCVVNSSSDTQMTSKGLEADVKVAEDRDSLKRCNSNTHSVSDPLPKRHCGSSGILVFHRPEANEEALKYSEMDLACLTAKDRTELEKILSGTSRFEADIERATLSIVLPEKHENFQQMFECIPKDEIEKEEFFNKLYTPLSCDTSTMSIRAIIQVSAER